MKDREAPCIIKQTAHTKTTKNSAAHGTEFLTSHRKAYTSNVGSLVCLVSPYPPKRLHLETDLVHFNDRRCDKEGAKFSKSLLHVGTAGSAGQCVGFALPQCK